MVSETRDRYLKKRNKEIGEVLFDPNRTPTARFWDAKEKMEEEAKVLEHCLGYHARSRMMESMALMLRYGLLEDCDLEGFSEDLRDALRAFRGDFE